MAALNGSKRALRKLKMVDLSARVRRRNLFDSAQAQSTAFVNRHSECSRKKPSEKQKKGVEQCVSKYRTQRAIPPLSCLFYSKCHSDSESTFGALRQRCRCSALNIYRCGQMGVGFTRAPTGVQITQQPPLADWKLLKTITDPDRGAHQAVMLLLKKAAQNRFL